MKKFLIILFFAITQLTFSKEEKKAMYDTSTVVVKKASSQTEKDIFADKDFIYKEDVKPSKGWLQLMWEWLLENLFGHVSTKEFSNTWKIVKYVSVILFVAGVVFVLWKTKFIGLLKGNSKKLSGAAFTDLPDDINEINIDALIDEAIKKGNYRLAVRWCFLKSLQLLNKQNQISWQPFKTNIDYQNELKNKNVKENFIKLSYVFEYVWYGEMSANEKLVLDYKNNIDSFNQNLYAKR